jgi:hypothetical protein
MYAHKVSLDNTSKILTHRRGVGAYTTTHCSKCSSMRISSVFQTELKIGVVELDSHADTYGVNDMARILEYKDQVADVSGFANSMQPLQNIPIVKAALAYDHPDTGVVIVLIINQVLYFGNQLDQTSFNPNQI